MALHERPDTIATPTPDLTPEQVTADIRYQNIIEKISGLPRVFHLKLAQDIDQLLGKVASRL